MAARARSLGRRRSVRGGTTPFIHVVQVLVDAAYISTLASLIRYTSVAPTNSHGHWTWRGKAFSREEGGVPLLNVAGRRVSVLRLMFQILEGPQPSTAKFIRTCGNPACIRPDHIAVLRKGEPLPEPLRGKKRRPQRRLDPAMKPIIVGAYRAGCSLEALAKTYKVNASTIKKVVEAVDA